nr:unnamed protein product [Callosobruchus analis]CAI5849937.1 unnamed protein product [Callosobruchus analis]
MSRILQGILLIITHTKLKL